MGVIRWLVHGRRRRFGMDGTVDPIGMDANGNMHDVALIGRGQMLHFSSCWCRGGRVKK